MHIATADTSDVERLSKTLRESDRMEVELAFQRPASAVLLASFQNARSCWSVRHESRTVAMFGVGRRRIPTVGTIWMLASNELLDNHVRFLRAGGRWVDRMMCGHDALTNFVHSKNVISMRWLKWLKFEFLELHRNFNGSGEDFWLFVKFANNVDEASRRRLRAALGE